MNEALVGRRSLFGNPNFFRTKKTEVNLENLVQGEPLLVINGVITPTYN